MLKKIRLELARTPMFPNGSTQHGYVIIAPLNRQDRLDGMTWMEVRDSCRVTKFWGTAPHRHGHLRLRTSHANDGDCQWYVEYDEGDNPDTPEIETDEEIGFNFANENFVLGEYVSFSDGVHEPMSFRVAHIDPADEASVHVTHL